MFLYSMYSQTVFSLLLSTFSASCFFSTKTLVVLIQKYHSEANSFPNFRYSARLALARGRREQRPRRDVGPRPRGRPVQQVTARRAEELREAAKVRAPLARPQAQEPRHQDQAAPAAAAGRRVLAADDEGARRKL